MRGKGRNKETIRILVTLCLCKWIPEFPTTSRAAFAAAAGATKEGGWSRLEI